MKALSLYSGGCDGLSLAGSWVGIESIAFCECDPECREQLSRRHPGKPIFTYDTEVTYESLQNNGIEPGGIDIILASPPCQCASVAGARLGDADGRNRWPQCLDIVCAVKPRWFVAENVPGLLSVNAGRLFGDILRRLAQMGYDAGWGVWGAADIGAPHTRDRLCLVAYRHDQRQLQPQGEHVSRGGRAFDGGTMADAKGTEQDRPVQDGNQTGRGRSANGSPLGDARRGPLRDDVADVGEAAGKIHKIANASLLGHPESERLQGQRPTGEPNAASRHFPVKFEGRSDQPGRRPAESGLGGVFDGVSARLAAQRWPAGRGAQQFSWEPPRTVKNMKGRAAQIKMYGNAVVPQWALIILAAVAEWEQGETEVKK